MDAIYLVVIEWPRTTPLVIAAGDIDEANEMVEKHYRGSERAFRATVYVQKPLLGNPGTFDEIYSEERARV